MANCITRACQEPCHGQCLRALRGSVDVAVAAFSRSDRSYVAEAGVFGGWTLGPLVGLRGPCDRPVRRCVKDVIESQT